MKNVLALIIILSSNILWAQPISNKLDISFWTGSVFPAGRSLITIDGISFPAQFSESSCDAAYASRILWNGTERFSLGLNIEYNKFSREYTNTRSSGNINMIVVAPVFAFNHPIIQRSLQANINFLPSLYFYDASIYTGDVILKTDDTYYETIHKINQLTPGAKLSLGLKLHVWQGISIGAEYGYAIQKDNNDITPEKMNYYTYGQVGIIFSIFYNKRYYL